MSITAWLENEFPVVVPGSGGQELRIDCPFCLTEDDKQHMYVNVAGKEVAHCFRCDWSGTHFQLVQQVTGVQSYAEIWSILTQPRAKLSNYLSIADKLARVKPEEKKLPLHQLHMPEWYRPFVGSRLNRLHYNVFKYALKRFSIEELEYYGIGYCTDFEQPYYTRLIIPVERGYFQARAIGTAGKPKYLNPDVDVAERLFNAEALNKYKHVYVAEGVISAKAIGRNAIATLRNAASQLQKKRMRDSQVRLFTISYDAGMETQNSVLKLADYLSNYGKEVVIRKYLEGDPDSSTEYEEYEYSPGYKINGLLSNLDFSELRRQRFQTS